MSAKFFCVMRHSVNKRKYYTRRNECTNINKLKNDEKPKGVL